MSPAGAALKWIQANILLTSTMCGVIAGIIIGGSFRYAELSTESIRYIGFPGELFMNSLKCIVLPLIAASLISGLSQLDSKSSGKIGSRAIMYYALTLTHAVILGIMLVLIIHPGDPTIKNNVTVFDSSAHRGTAVDKLIDLVRNMFPPNIIQAMFEQQQTVYMAKRFHNGSIIPDEFVVRTKYVAGMNVLGIIIFCIVMGIVISRVGPAANPLRDLFIAVDVVISAMVRIIMWMGPLGIASLIAEKMLQVTDLLGTLQMLAVFMFTVTLGLALQAFITLPLIYFAASKKNPYRFLKGLAHACMTSMGTSSSAATMPVTFKCLDELGVDPRVSKFVLPVGTTVNMDGTALYEAVASIFIAQMNGLDMGIGEVVTVAITATLASVGAAAVPSGGLVTLILVLSALGLPASDVSLVMAVDWLLGRLRCTTNVIGDAFACGFVDSLCTDDLPPLPSTVVKNNVKSEKVEIIIVPNEKSNQY